MRNLVKSVLLGAAVFTGGIWANENDVATMQAALQTMQREMQALRAEREQLHSNAGAVPESLRTANGNATIRIGGDFRIQYGMGWSNGYGRAAADAPNARNANYKSAHAGWAIHRAQLTFDIDLSCDTSAYIDLRFDGGGAYGGLYGGDNLAGNILNQAYWKWKNIGGSGLQLSVGLMYVPFGMWANNDMGGYNWYGPSRALITYPFVMNQFEARGSSLYNIGNASQMLALNQAVGNESTNLGVYASYKITDEIIAKAGVMASGINGNMSINGIGRTTAQNNPGVDYNNDLRNLGIVDHVAALGYNPCWAEGLHLEVGYMGRFDTARGNRARINDPYAGAQATSGDSSYNPSFDFGVAYQATEKLVVFAEYMLAVNPFYNDGTTMALSAGFDYKLTSKLTVGAGFDWYRAAVTGDNFNGDPNPNNTVMTNAVPLYGNIYRLSVGGNYNFGNGLYFQAQYYHDLAHTTGAGDQNVKDADVILFQTGYTF